MSDYLHGDEVHPPESYPREIRLPPFVWPVRYFKWLKDPEDDDKSLRGCVAEDEGEVWIEWTGRAPEWLVLATVAHEARHLFPWPLDDEAEERCVRMLDYCEPQLARHNPRLADYVTGRMNDRDG